MKIKHCTRSYTIGELLISEQQDGQHVAIRQTSDPALLTKEEFSALAELRFEGLFEEEVTQ